MAGSTECPGEEGEWLQLGVSSWGAAGIGPSGGVWCCLGSVQVPGVLALAIREALSLWYHEGYGPGGDISLSSCDLLLL